MAQSQISCDALAMGKIQVIRTKSLDDRGQKTLLFPHITKGGKLKDARIYRLMQSKAIRG